MFDDVADRVGSLLDTVANRWADRRPVAGVVDMDHSPRPVDSGCRRHRNSLAAAERHFVRARTCFDSDQLAVHTFDRLPAVDNYPELVDAKWPVALHDGTLAVHRTHWLDSLAVHRTVALLPDSLLADRQDLRSKAICKTIIIIIISKQLILALDH